MEEILVHLPTDVIADQEQKTAKIKNNQKKLEARMKASHKKRKPNQEYMVAKLYCIQRVGQENMRAKIKISLRVRGQSRNDTGHGRNIWEPCTKAVHMLTVPQDWASNVLPES
jgi:hypothetical protein